jgi:hypothetical protein
MAKSPLRNCGHLFSRLWRIGKSRDLPGYFAYLMGDVREVLIMSIC